MTIAAADRFSEHLRARLGPAVSAPADLAARVTRSLGLRSPSVVLAPPDPAGVAQALAECSAEGWPVLAAGGGTWLGGTDSASDRAPVVISTARLERVTEHEPADLVVGVEAGIPLTRLREHLAAQAQWLPLDPAAADSATIGAVAALGSAGPLRAGHGTPRDMALGVELASGDGRLLRFGGRVVKNVAGYDGVRLAVGSRGALGIITGLYLRVRGTPRVDRTLALACGPGEDGAQRGAAAALAVRDAIAADALELLSPAVTARLFDRPPQASGWTLLIRLMGADAAVSDAVDRAQRLAAGGLGASSTPAAAGMAEVRATVWLDLSRIEAEATLALTLTGTPTTLPAGLLNVSGILGRDNEMSGWMCAAHAADGVIRLWRRDRATAPADGLGQVVERVVSGVADADWTVRYDMAPGIPAKRRDAPAVAELTSRLVAVFDPAGILRAGGGA